MQQMMNYKIFDYAQLAKLSKDFQTPCYIYDTQLLQDTITVAKSAATTNLNQPYQIHYALKANDNKQLLQLIQQCGLGIDCVSGGELEKAISSGFDTQHIVFAGVGKQDWEINAGIKANIYAFNCESLQELVVINELAAKVHKTVSIMIRINPDIDAKTHKKITTGNYDNKFGVMFDDVITYLPQLAKLTNIKLIGLHYHIGSQIKDMAIFARLAQEVSLHYAIFAGLGFNLTDLDIGGGLGVDYVNPQNNPITNFNQYFHVIQQNLQLPPQIKLHFELGRSLVSQCGILLATVLFTKTTAGTNFAILDAGMNDLMRPALYEARHNIRVLRAHAKTAQMHKYHIVGPVCESTDIFAKDVLLPELLRGDKIILETCGAYGRVLANQYNSRKLVSEYCI